MIDALNAIEGQEECRTFVRLNVLSLTMTLGAIVFLLRAVGAVVAFPLVMSTFGLKSITGTATWLIRWPLLLVLMIGALAVFYRFGPCRDAAPRWWLSPGAAIAALLWRPARRCPSPTDRLAGAAMGLMMWRGGPRSSVWPARRSMRSSSESARGLVPPTRSMPIECAIVA